MNEKLAALTLEAVRDRGRATVHEISVATSSSTNATRKRLLYMFREGILGRKPVQANGKGAAHYVYWPATDKPYVVPDTDDTRQCILGTVLEASQPITSKKVARKLGFSVSTVQPYLLALTKEKKLQRDPSRRGYLYEQYDGKQEVKAKDTLTLGDDIDAAIRENRSRWRKGERFTQEEKKQYREEQGRRRHY